MSRYSDLFERSLKDPEGFWGEAAKEIRWRRPPEQILDRKNPEKPQWFAGGVLNTCENALDVHVETGRANQLALIWDSPVTGQIQRFTYRELRDRTAIFAGALRKLGVGKGDRVVIYMPMVPEAI